MASITFAVDDELKSELAKFMWVAWSELVRQELTKRLEFLGFINSKLADSSFSKEDAEKLGELAKTNRLKELKSMGLIDGARS